MYWNIRPCFLLILGFTLLLLPLLGLSTIAGASESREAHIVQLILDTKNWILPLRDGILPSKPPLYHWLTAILCLLLGAEEVSPFLARFVSTLAASLMLALTYICANAVAKSTPRYLNAQSENIALSAAAILAATYGFVSLAIDCRVDMLFSSLAMLAIAPIFLCLVEPNLGSKIPNRTWLLFWIASGLAVLAKGPIGFGLPALIVFGLISLQVSFRRAVIECFKPRLAWLVFLCICLPWYYLAWRQQGQAFIDRQILFENIQRISDGEYMNSQPWWFYFPQLLRTAFPWSSIFIFGSLWYFKQSRNSQVGLQASKVRLTIFWAWFVVIIFSFAAGKRASYLLPAYPALAISVSLFCWHFYETSLEVWRYRILFFLRNIFKVFSVVLLAIFLILNLVRNLVAPSPLLAELQYWYLSVNAYVAWYAVIIFACIFSAWKSKSSSRRLIFGALTFSVTLSFFLCFGLAIKNHIRAFKLAALDIKAKTMPNSKIVCVRHVRDEYFDALLYHLRIAIATQTRDSLALDNVDYLILKYVDWVTILEANPGYSFKVLGQYRPLDDNNSQESAKEYWLVAVQKSI